MTKRKRMVLVFGVLVLGAAIALGAYFWLRPVGVSSTLTLYGNVDIREVDAAFNDTGRVAKLLVQEGDVVHKGELIALMDDKRFSDELDAANAQAAQQKQVLVALQAGSRPEQIAQAKARMDALEVVYKNDKANYERYATLAPTGAATLQKRDDAQAAFLNAEQNYMAAKQAYELAVKGPRAEDIAAAQASYDGAVANAKLAQQKLDDTKLYAPVDGIIESRVQEPGDMVSPATPIYTIARTDPLWVRAYVPESELGRIKLGMAADITTDSYPDKVYPGWVGYLSPTAEFTPKNVETPDLRAQLVYQLRVYTCASENELRLGMPATVKIDLTQQQKDQQVNRGANECGGGDATGN
ncbi:efflux RND transporter periplasmic adaptor subunit [Thioclava sp.]|uniref:efflux RND transporter periplasmic adaptor subunit n=1 Tax=Thioclava sp. TaxID=1933450 RepID=UPI003AA807A8